MIGRTLKHYQVEELLGKGGMGEVYRARDLRLGRPVALKVLPERFTADDERRRRFVQEARAASAVNHPVIAQIYDVDECDGTAFIVMELVDGRTLRALVQGRELDLLAAIEIVAQVAEGLVRAHQAGIVHRDIKSDNIMLTRDGHAKLLDFGLAKLHEAPASTAGEDELSRMETLARSLPGAVLGTPRYMSPEQARGRPADARSDLFSLGVVFYELVTGQLPFGGQTALDTLHAIAFEESAPVSQLRPQVPAVVQRIVTRCLRKRPEDRYADAGALATDLRAAQREIETGVSHPPALGERLRRSFGRLPLPEGSELWQLVVAVGVLLLVGLIMLLRRGVGTLVAALPWVLLGLWAWRAWRNRDRRLLRRFTDRLRRLPEVRFVAYDGRRVTVVVDRALAKTYLRVNSLAEQLNARLFFGEPFSVSVRDNLSPDETRTLFGGSGVLYVRTDVLETQV